MKLLKVKRNKSFTITYINHSCFLVELEQVILLFDYYSAGLPEDGIVPGISVLLESDEKRRAKSLYVFVSHKHRDHFDRRIFDLEQICPQVTYILSKDARMNERYMQKTGICESAWTKIRYVLRNQEYEIDGLAVRTFASTDAGVAFLVGVEGKWIYHAGDLNWWSFPGETAAEAADMERRFKQEIDKLKGRTIDAAFLPLDPRLEDRFYLGFDYFMRNTDTKSAYPMHFWGDASAADRLKAMKQSEPYRDRIADIKK